VFRVSAWSTSVRQHPRPRWSAKVVRCWACWYWAMDGLLAAKRCLILNVDAGFWWKLGVGCSCSMPNVGKLLNDKCWQAACQDVQVAANRATCNARTDDCSARVFFFTIFDSERFTDPYSKNVLQIAAANPVVAFGLTWCRTIHPPTNES
jgi:hypothetical protein